MRLEEFDSFKDELKQLCATLGKAYTDALAQAYWRSLKEVNLEDIQANVERILLNATAETKFPKPQQLRQGARIPVAHADAQSTELRQKSLAMRLGELDALEAWHLLASYLARCDVEEDPGSLFFAERFAWCKLQARKLLEKHGQRWCVADSHCMHTASRLLGGEHIHARHNELWRQAS